LRLINQIL